MARRSVAGPFSTARTFRLHLHTQAWLLTPLRPQTHRVASKQELGERIMAGTNDVNRHPVIHTWTFKLADAA
jgi:hypothetical protein